MDKDLVLKNMRLHNLDSPFLIGNSQNGDKITEAKQECFISRQGSLF